MGKKGVLRRKNKPNQAYNSALEGVYECMIDPGDGRKRLPHVPAIAYVMRIVDADTGEVTRWTWYEHPSGRPLWPRLRQADHELYRRHSKWAAKLMEALVATHKSQAILPGIPAIAKRPEKNGLRSVG